MSLRQFQTQCVRPCVTCNEPTTTHYANHFPVCPGCRAKGITDGQDRDRA